MIEPWVVVEANSGRTRAARLRELSLEGRLDVNDDNLVVMIESRMCHSGVVSVFDESNAPLGVDVGVQEADLVFVRLLLWDREVDGASRRRLQALRAPGCHRGRVPLERMTPFINLFA